jgi:hypothetical protein
VHRSVSLQGCDHGINIVCDCSVAADKITVHISQAGAAIYAASVNEIEEECAAADERLQVVPEAVRNEAPQLCQRPDAFLRPIL